MASPKLRGRSLSAPPLFIADLVEEEDRQIEEQALKMLGVTFALDIESLENRLAAQEGMALLCNSRLDDADALYDEQLPRGSLVSHWHGAETAFIRAMFSDEKKDNDHAYELIENTVKIARAGLSAMESKSWFSYKQAPASDLMGKFRLLCRKADATLLFSCLHGKNRNYVKATYWLRHAWKQLCTAHTLYVDNQQRFDGEAPDDVSVLLMDHGAMLFFISLIPATFRYIASAVGLDGDRVRGLKDLEAAHDIGGIRTPAVLLLLLQLNVGFFKDYGTALTLLDEAERLFPTGSVFFSIGVTLHRALGHHKKCLDLEHRIIQCSDQLPAMRCIAYYDEGYTWVLLRKWDRAIASFELFFSDCTVSLSFKAMACYYAALSCSMVGKSERAVEYASDVGHFVRPQYSNDVWAQRKCNEIIECKGVLSKPEMATVCGLLAVEALEYSDALVYFESASSNDVDLKTMVAYGRGIAQFKLGDEVEGKQNLLIACESHPLRELHIPAFAWVKLAEFVKNDKKEFNRCLSKAKSMNKYDLARQLAWEMQRLEDE